MALEKMLTVSLKFWQCTLKGGMNVFIKFSWQTIFMLPRQFTQNKMMIQPLGTLTVGTKIHSHPQVLKYFNVDQSGGHTHTAHCYFTTWGRLLGVIQLKALMHLWQRVKCSSESGWTCSGYRQPPLRPIWWAGSCLTRRRPRHGG